MDINRCPSITDPLVFPKLHPNARRNQPNDKHKNEYQQHHIAMPSTITATQQSTIQSYRSLLKQLLSCVSLDTESETVVVFAFLRRYRVLSVELLSVLLVARRDPTHPREELRCGQSISNNNQHTRNGARTAVQIGIGLGAVLPAVAACVVGMVGNIGSDSNCSAVAPVFIRKLPYTIGRSTRLCIGA